MAIRLDWRGLVCFCLAWLRFASHQWYSGISCNIRYWRYTTAASTLLMYTSTSTSSSLSWQNESVYFFCLLILLFNKSAPSKIDALPLIAFMQQRILAWFLFCSLEHSCSFWSICHFELMRVRIEFIHFRFDVFFHFVSFRRWSSTHQQQQQKAAATASAAM